MPRSKPVILVTKRPKSAEKQAILSRSVAQIHANAVIRRLSSENVGMEVRRTILAQLIQDAKTTQGR